MSTLQIYQNIEDQKLNLFGEDLMRSQPDPSPGRFMGRTGFKLDYEITDKDIYKFDLFFQDIYHQYDKLIILDEPLGDLRYSFRYPVKPWIPKDLKMKIKKMSNKSLNKNDITKLIEDIGKISVNFYEVKTGKFIAVKIDGSIVDYADTEIELLLKVQGRQFNMPVFVWEAGAKSYPGWKT